MVELYTYRYPHPAVACDCVVFSQSPQGWKVLLIRRKNDPYRGLWAFPGGFLNPDEDAEQGALRELEEETGLSLPHAEQFFAATAPGRDPRERVISIVHYAVVDHELEVAGGDDAEEAGWFGLDALPELAFDHGEILQMAITKFIRI